MDRIIYDSIRNMEVDSSGYGKSYCVVSDEMVDTADETCEMCRSSFMFEDIGCMK